MGLLPSLGARLAKLTSNPLLMLTDGEARILQGAPPLGVTEDVVEGWMPFRLVLESVVPYGKRHVMMGATQIDREGNQNISAIGDWAAAEAPAARRPRGARQHRQQHDVLLGAEALPARLRRARRRRLRRRPHPRRGRRPGGDPLPPGAPGGQQPRGLRLRRPRATRCGSSRCTPASASRTSQAASAFEIAVDRRGARDPRAHARRADADPRGARPAVAPRARRSRRGSDRAAAPHPADRAGRRTPPGRADRHGLGRRTPPRRGHGQRRRSRHPRLRHDVLRRAGARDRRGQGPHRPAVRGQPARRRRPTPRSGSTC